MQILPTSCVTQGPDADPPLRVPCKLYSEATDRSVPPASGRPSKGGRLVSRGWSPNVAGTSASSYRAGREQVSALQERAYGDVDGDTSFVTSLGTPRKRCGCMSSMSGDLETRNPLAHRGLLPVCHDDEIKRVLRRIQTWKAFAMTLRSPCRPVFSATCRSSDRHLADQSP